jgi:acylpyruvate hydrolase
MKLASFVSPDGVRLSGEVRDGRVVAFDDGSTVRDRLASGDLAAASGPDFGLDEVTLLAPHAPEAIFGIGLNYAAHVREGGRELPEAPVVFMKTPRSAADPGAPVKAPEVVRRLDYEGELAIVMGAGGQVAGYAVADDLSARDLQRREPQWTRAKGFDRSCPSLVAFLLETCTLEPGDLILTGTPSGVGVYMDPPRFLTTGDVVRIEIELLGAIEHPVA